MILGDDIGYSDLGCYGGEIETPNLDRLAENGLRFTRYYTNNMCVPTRASLMTGLDVSRAVVNQRIPMSCATLPQVLRDGGYGTYMAGKWHLPADPDDFENLPCQRGFDQYFGTTIGACSFWAPATLMRQSELVPEEYEDPGFYYTDAIAHQSVQYVDDAVEKGKPFFLYVAFNAAHWPLHAWPVDIEHYAGRYAEGWDVLRKRRHARMKELGVVNPEWPLSPRNPEVPAWEDEPHPAWQQRRMEVYAAQITSMDRGIGRIVDALEEHGLMDNTLIVYQNDNGGCHVEYTTDRTGAFLFEKTRTGEPIVPGNIPDLMPGPETTFQSYGYGWANVSNTPFRLYKQHDHEGGILTPLIVHWPGVVETGTLTDQLAHVVDLAPTFLEAAGVAHPGGEYEAPHGRSLLPVLRGGTREAPETLYWKWSRGKAIRHKQWKLVSKNAGPWELYDIEADGTELHDVAGVNPDLVERLAGMWDAWHGRARSG